MKVLLRGALLSALLASCAPTLGGEPGLILVPGQVWSVAIDGHDTVTLTVGSAQRSVNPRVSGYLHLASAADASATVDTFAEGGAGNPAAFITAMQIWSDGMASHALSCTVRFPSGVPGTAQAGLARVVGEAEFAKDDDAATDQVTSGVARYAATGVMDGGVPCTLTRLK
ncbi:hypothetical protein E7T09_16795 [Deinococcus sp. KSM4-11]|uniref:hypothetical protein n=1 Tax=Deinococcus sp. KSM4-11 TaxID=2568654 RepID=UPI0010A5875A|nr:hypothetical protein [Deinococcus sp. KSM4-11]THF85605.1 hypothetical protein E7T09_16795 [Deinococcus sp. KSM4-11]